MRANITNYPLHNIVAFEQFLLQLKLALKVLNVFRSGVPFPIVEFVFFFDKIL